MGKGRQHQVDRLLERVGRASLALNERETMALRLMSHGMTQSMVGKEMHLSRDTVDDALELCRIKLNAKNTTEACCEAIRRGLFP